MRPASIVTFDRFFLLSLAIGLVHSVIGFQDSVAMLNADPNAAQLGFGSSFLMITLVFSFAIPLLLWFLIARKASNVAKWILVVLTGIGLLGIVSAIATLLERGPVTAVLTLLTTGLQLYAILQLFKPDAKAWLEGRGGNSNDPDIFS
ncbi:MAG: hypothetical protein J0M19_11820 [Sphingomonadales bacterium]|nr:hypothetical protein [Sphingomonadales bacterium]